jgi:subtilisin family serine protease
MEPFMKRPVWVAVTATAAAIVLSAAPANLNPLGDTPAFAATGGPVDQPLLDKTATGGTVRVNVLTGRRADIASAAQEGTTLVSYDTLPLVTLRVDNAGLQKLQSKPGVISVTEDAPTAPTLNESTVVIGSDKAAAAGKNGSGVTVAVLDTGVETGHPFLGGRVKQEACFSVEDATYVSTSLCPDGTTAQEGAGAANTAIGPCSTLGAACDHGTHVAGIAAGNGAGITAAPTRGVAPGADIAAIQVFSKFDNDDYCGAGNSPCVLSFTSSQIKALEKVLAWKQAGTNIVAANMSLGAERWTTACANDPRKTIIDSLHTANVATVIAAGNNGWADAVSAPACVDTAVAVGSTTDDDQLSTFSNRGPLLDLLAPGTSIVSSVSGGGYGSKNGTSMAAPHVAGALAVLKQTYPTKDIDSLVSLLATSGTPIVYTGATTPRINVGKAVTAVENDINGDGRPDILARDSNGDLWLHPNTGNTGTNTFGTRSQVATGWNTATAISTADINNDGRPDILARDSNGDLWLHPNTGNTGTNTFGTRSQVATGWNTATAISTADINNDGRPDILARDHSGDLWLHPNTGNTGTNTFGTRSQVATGWNSMTAINAGISVYGQIINENSGKCLVARDSDQNAVQFTCDFDSAPGTYWPDQYWSAQYAGVFAGQSAYQLKNVNSGKCLVVQGTANNSTAFQYTCGAHVDQYWWKSGSGDSWQQLKNVNSGKCLVVQGTANNSTAFQYTCGAYVDQYWSSVAP